MDLSKIQVKPITTKLLSKATKSHSNGGFNINYSDNTEISNSSQVFNLVNLDALFLDVNQDKSSKSRYIKTMDDLLDKLENIRRSLLTGSISKNTLLNINNSLESLSKGRVDDPKLKYLILEVETRVKVELAKLDKMIVGQK